jgi:hypothetical protein
MSVRTTVTLDDDVIERVKQESRARGASFRDTLNELVRAGLLQRNALKHRSLQVRPFPMGLRPGLSYDNIEALIEYAEGPWHR